MKGARRNIISQRDIKSVSDVKTLTLFTEQEMDAFKLRISNPEKKAEKLFIKYTHKYIKPHYTRSETAQLLGITVTGLENLCGEGAIKFNQSGSKIRFYAGDIYRFLIKCARQRYPI